MNPLVSVIMPVHNGAHFLRESIPSVLAQDYQPIEIIVADDGSTDDSADVAESYPEVECLRLPKGGVSRARNLAVERSSGEWLAFLDADDIWLPGKLSAQVALASEQCEADLILCHQVCRFEGEVPAWFRGKTDGSEVTAYEPSAWLLRRATFEHVGPFDEARDLGEDTEWLSRAWDLGYTHVMSPQSLVIRRIHSSNATGTIPSARRVIFDILRESVARKHLRREAK
ncbi:MAG: glycosyltransferase family 2 protein [Dehalococcoidia bacterium]